MNLQLFGAFLFVGGVLMGSIGFVAKPLIVNLPFIGGGKYSSNPEMTNLALWGGAAGFLGIYLIYLAQLPSMVREDGLFLNGIVFVIMLVCPATVLLAGWLQITTYLNDKKEFEVRLKRLGVSVSDAKQLVKIERERVESERENERRKESERKEKLRIAEELRKIEQERQAIEDDKNAWGDMWDRKLEIEKILQTLSDEQLHLFDGMPPVKAYLTNKPIAGGKGLACAYGDKEVHFLYDYYKDADMDSLIHVMKHEMTHNWINWKGIKMDDPHGQEFQDKLNSILGAVRNFV